MLPDTEPVGPCSIACRALKGTGCVLYRMRFAMHGVRLTHPTVVWECPSFWMTFLNGHTWYT